MTTSGRAMLRQWERVARRQGWTVSQGGRHLLWHGPDGQVRVTTPSTPGRGRAMANCRARLRRAGLEIS